MTGSMGSMCLAGAIESWISMENIFSVSALLHDARQLRKSCSSTQIYTKSMAQKNMNG